MGQGTDTETVCMSVTHTELATLLQAGGEVGTDIGQVPVKMMLESLRPALHVWSLSRMQYECGLSRSPERMWKMQRFYRFLRNMAASFPDATGKGVNQE